jgi:hypothetical protein
MILNSEIPATPMTLMPGGERLIAVKMYCNGKSFLEAAHLLYKNGGSNYVFLHLCAQAFELILKGILLLYNYKRYLPKLRNLGHNLVKSASTVQEETGFSLLTREVSDELVPLNSLFSAHRLRYASGLNIFIHSHPIPVKLLKKIHAVTRLTDRKLGLRPPNELPA